MNLAGQNWASALGVVAIVLGVFLTAWHGNEWMKQTVLTGAMPASGQLGAADCPPGELQEEGLTAQQCRFMVAHVQGLVDSMPAWFSAVMGWLSFLGMLLAFASVLAGGALVNGNIAASLWALGLFAALAGVDVLEFVAAVNAGPIIRSMYLWSIVLWLLLHLMLALAALAGRQGSTGPEPAATH